MPVHLRRQLLGDAYGDYNFLADPSASEPFVYPFAESAARKTVRDDRWFQPAPGCASFPFDMAATHPKVLRLSASVATNVSHLLTQSGLPVIVRFDRIYSLGTPTDGTRYILANPDTVVASATEPMAGTDSVELTSLTPGTRWRVGLETPSGGGTIYCAEVKAWEFLDLEPFLSSLFFFDASGDVFTVPFGRSFSGRGAWLREKSFRMELLISRSDPTTLSYLQALMTPDPQHPLELFFDSYLWKVAPLSWRIRPLGPLVLSVSLEMRFLSDCGLFQDRYRVLFGGWNSLPVTHTVTPTQATIPMPAEIRVSLPDNHGGSYLRVICQPADQMMTLAISPSQVGRVFVFRENGSVWRYDRSLEGQTGPLRDVTSQLKLRDLSGNEITNGPPLLHPTDNRVTVELLDSSFNRLSSLPTNTSGILSVAWTERKGELTLP